MDKNRAVYCEVDWDVEKEEMQVINKHKHKQGEWKGHEKDRNEKQSQYLCSIVVLWVDINSTWRSNKSYWLDAITITSWNKSLVSTISLSLAGGIENKSKKQILK